jgi:hypothetical protein
LTYRLCYQVHNSKGKQRSTSTLYLLPHVMGQESVNKQLERWQNQQKNTNKPKGHYTNWIFKRGQIFISIFSISESLYSIGTMVYNCNVDIHIKGGSSPNYILTYHIYLTNSLRNNSTYWLWKDKGNQRSLKRRTRVCWRYHVRDQGKLTPEKTYFQQYECK